MHFVHAYNHSRFEWGPSYWAVTNIDYMNQRTARRIGTMIAIVWALSVLVAAAPLFGWKDPKWLDRVVNDRDCMVSQDIGYQIFATASSFYVPLAVILVLYWRIFQAARKRIHRRQQVGGWGAVNDDQCMHFVFLFCSHCLRCAGTNRCRSLC